MGPPFMNKIIYESITSNKYFTLVFLLIFSSLPGSVICRTSCVWGILAFPSYFKCYTNHNDKSFAFRKFANRKASSLILYIPLLKLK